MEAEKRRKLVNYINSNGYIVDVCNEDPENEGNFYYLSDMELISIYNDVVNEIKQEQNAKRESEKNQVQHGDRISAMGINVTIDRILFQCFIPGSGYDIEFTDKNGIYRHWKQWEDGGNISRWTGREYKEI